MKELRKINLVVAAGSVDGILATAALLRLIGSEDVEIIFTQAFQVDQLKPDEWKTGRRVAFVDLAVNNRNPEMTAGFVKRIEENGHEIVAIIDEHDAQDWAKLVDVNKLVIAPVSQNEGDIKSSGALLLKVAEGIMDAHGKELCVAADAADRMDFTTHFGWLTNAATKAAIWDNSRREHLAKHFAKHHEPDEKIKGWVAEYEAILRNHKEILAAREDLGNGIIRIDARGKRVDVTTLMGEVYALPGVKVCLLRTEAFNPAKKAKEAVASFGTRTELDVLSTIKEAGISAGGFASKANVALEDEEAALAAIRQALKR